MESLLELIVYCSLSASIVSCRDAICELYELLIEPVPRAEFCSAARDASIEDFCSSKEFIEDDLRAIKSDIKLLILALVPFRLPMEKFISAHNCLTYHYNIY